MSTWNKLVSQFKLHCRINLMLSSLHIVFLLFAWWLVVFTLCCHMVVSTKIFLYCGPSPAPPNHHWIGKWRWLNCRLNAGSYMQTSTEKEYSTGLTSQRQYWCQYFWRLLLSYRCSNLNLTENSCRPSRHCARASALITSGFDQPADP